MAESLDQNWRGPLQAEIDLSAVAANVRAIREVIGPTCGVIAVVKANGYGLGAARVGSAAIRGGASMLAVARAGEGVELRRAGYEGPILVMSYVSPAEAPTAVEHRLTVTLHRAATAAALQHAAERQGLGRGEVAVHLKVDTGLGRFGCTPGELAPLARNVAGCDRLRIEGLMTHFAHADAADLDFSRRQLQLFGQLREGLESSSLRFKIVHAANSAAALHMPESRLDMVRVGIILSGHSPTPDRALPVTLKKALRISTTLARVFKVEEGDTVGYGRTWRAASATTIGLIPIGYGDGYSRALTNKAHVLVEGKRCPVVGIISMDQTALDLSTALAAREGDEVVVLGAQGTEEVTADELAGHLGTISYEILTSVAARVPRRYLWDGEDVSAFSAFRVERP